MSGALMGGWLVGACLAAVWRPWAEDSSVSPSVGDAPDCTVAIFADQQRSVMRHRNSHRPSPHCLIRDDKSGKEVFVLPSRSAIGEAQSHHLVSSAARAVPRTAQRHERIAAIVLWELHAVIEGDAEWRRMR